MSETELPPKPEEILIERKGRFRKFTNFSIAAKLKVYFFAGILITAPITITIWLALGLIEYVDLKIVPYLPEKLNPDTYISNVFGYNFGIPGLGLIILVVSITLIGATTAGFLGRWIVARGEQILYQMPLVRSLYKMVKQLFETVLTDQSKAFRQAVLVEYPRRDSWTIGFVTADPVDPALSKAINQGQDKDDDHLVAVFVPTTPNPTSGFLLFVPKKDTRPLDMPVDEAFKRLISIGIINSEDKTKLKKIKKVKITHPPA